MFYKGEHMKEFSLRVRALAGAGLAVLEWRLGPVAGTLPDRLMEWIFLCIIVSAAVMDARTMVIPDRYVGELFILGTCRLVWQWIAGEPETWGQEALFAWPAGLVLDRLLALVCLSLPLLLLAAALPGSMGGGDIKLLAAGGFYLGVRQLFVSFLAAMVFAGLVGAALLVSGRVRPGDGIPLGPFLCGGMVMALIMRG